MERNYQQHEAVSPLLPIHGHNALGFWPTAFDFKDISKQ
jgi:hypothetical protein